MYDGDCAICRYWVAYWRELTQGRVDYRPYQDAAKDFPEIPLEAFQRAIQLIETGRVYSGAAAALFVFCATRQDARLGGGATRASPASRR